MRKTTKKKIAPIAAAVLAVILVGGLWMYPIVSALAHWVLAVGSGGLLLSFAMICYALVGVSIIVGALLALRQRLKEIDRGEEEDAEQY